MKICGHSGNKITLQKLKGKVVLVKEGNIRLKNQAEKQKIYQQLLKNVEVSVPNIISHTDTEIIMDYISNSVNMIEFLEKTNHFGIEWLTHKIKTIMNMFIHNSQLLNVTQQFNDKLQNTLSKCLEKTNDIQLFRCVNNYFNREKFNIVIPVKYCHGDLTLSNMLVNQNNLKLYFIDFLDVYIESPLQDMVKLRQDTYFLWTLKLCDFSFDHNKLVIILNELDYKLDAYFSQFSFYKEYYIPFQVLNLLRIIPYSNDQSVYKFLKKCIYTLIRKND